MIIYTFTNLDEAYGHGINFIRIDKFDSDRYTDNDMPAALHIYREFISRNIRRHDCIKENCTEVEDNCCHLTFVSPSPEGTNQNNIVSTIRQGHDVKFSLHHEDVFMSSNFEKILAECKKYGFSDYQILEIEKHFNDGEIIDAIVIEENNFKNYQSGMFCYDSPSPHFPFIFVPECFSELRFNVINLIEEEDDDVILEKMNFCHIIRR